MTEPLTDSEFEKIKNKKDWVNQRTIDFLITTVDSLKSDKQYWIDTTNEWIEENVKLKETILALTVENENRFQQIKKLEKD